MSKLFSVVGVSTLNGNTSIRVANDIKREKVLARNGHTNINLIELPNAMTKVDATAYFTAYSVGDPTATPKVTFRDKAGRFTKQAFQFVTA